tara:strand:- start:720 stop:932 length:213 start_codon:yes stop_codon:yes gene_type:complete
MSDMRKLGQALSNLKVTSYACRGLPTNETEFNSMFSKVTGEDENGTAIESSNPSDFGVTWSQIKTEMDKL